MDQNSIVAVMRRLEPYFADLDAVPRAAVATYDKYDPLLRIDHSPRTAASCIYDHMVAAAVRQFEGRSGIRMFEMQQLKLWIVEEHSVIRWKKMDEDGRTRNYPTQQAQAYDRNLPLPGIPEEPTRLTVGYFLNDVGAIERIQVARPNGKLVDWCAALNWSDDRKVWVWEEVSKQRRL